VPHNNEGYQIIWTQHFAVNAALHSSTYQAIITIIKYSK
jgi:hypothetical protein